MGTLVPKASREKHRDGWPKELKERSFDKLCPSFRPWIF